MKNMKSVNPRHSLQNSIDKPEKNKEIKTGHKGEE